MEMAINLTNPIKISFARRIFYLVVLNIGDLEEK